MRRFVHIGFAALLVVFSTTANAATLSDRYSSYWALGDSLTNSGNLWALAPSAIPSPPYYQGRLSNGPTYAEHISAEFRASGKATGNLGYALAQAMPNRDVVPDLLAQAFSPFPIYASGEAGLVSRSDAFGRNPLVSLFFGSNDIFAAFEEGTNPIRAARNAANAVLAAVKGLALFGVRDFAVMNLPDLADTPRFLAADAASRAAAQQATLAFNTRIEKGTALLDMLPRIDVTLVDIHGAFKDVLANPGELGFTNVTQPCFDRSGPIPTLCADPDKYLFFDEVHPNRVAHGAIADLMRDSLGGQNQASTVVALAPVPLPAAFVSLLTALVVLRAARFRRA